MMLQTLNILQHTDIGELGYNGADIRTLYQAMSLAFADRDFYYGDPTFRRKSPSRRSRRNMRPRAQPRRSGTQR